MPPSLAANVVKITKVWLHPCVQKGELIFISDTLSRSCPKSDTSNSSFLEENIDAQICAVIENINVSPKQLYKIASLTDNDLELRALKGYLLSEWPKDKKTLPEVIRQYWNDKDSLTFLKPNNLILKNNAIVIPKCLRQEMLYRLHFTHSGISKTLLRAKKSIYWPNMYS